MKRSTIINPFTTMSELFHGRTIFSYIISSVFTFTHTTDSLFATRASTGTVYTAFCWFYDMGVWSQRKWHTRSCCDREHEQDRLHNRPSQHNTVRTSIITSIKHAFWLYIMVLDYWLSSSQEYCHWLSILSSLNRVFCCSSRYYKSTHTLFEILS